MQEQARAGHEAGRHAACCPSNTIAKDSLTRLQVYRGGEHEHAAQKPEAWAAE